MLDLIGDILNWIAAGVIFPLMFLPVAALFEWRSAKYRATLKTLSWILLYAAFFAAGFLFVALTPSLSIKISAQDITINSGLIVLIGAAIILGGGPARAIAKLSPPFEAIIRITSRTVMWLLLGMALVQFGVVVLRYVFGINYIFMQESITYMHGAVFLLASGYALLTNDHVRVDIFYSGASEKRKALIDLLGTYLFLFPICLLLLWTASPYVSSSWSVLERSTETSGIQGVYILKSFIPAFAVLLAMAGFSIAARAAETIRDRE